MVDADPHADPPWMVTAYIDGPSLQEAADRGGPLPPDEVRALGAGLAEGLAAIHSCGLVHRDLKPGNVIMAADGPRIIDFGIARAIDASTGLTSTGAVVGTVAFMSPEQIRGEVAGPASDVFSLGSVLAFAATGRPPFGSDSTVSIMFRVVNQPPDLAGVVDGELREVIARCLAKAPSDRPAIQAVLAALTRPDPALVAARAPSDAAPAAAGYQPSTQTRAPKPVEPGAGHQALLRVQHSAAEQGAARPAVPGPSRRAHRRSCGRRRRARCYPRCLAHPWQHAASGRPPPEHGECTRAPGERRLTRADRGLLSASAALRDL